MADLLLVDGVSPRRPLGRVWFVVAPLLPRGVQEQTDVLGQYLVARLAADVRHGGGAEVLPQVVAVVDQRRGHLLVHLCGKG